MSCSTLQSPISASLITNKGKQAAGLGGSSRAQDGIGG
jgi:hypothetical protein